MTEEEKKETLKEAKILEALSHPNIVKFREVYKTKKGKLCIVMEYADGKFNKIIIMISIAEYSDMQIIQAISDSFYIKILILLI